MIRVYLAARYGRRLEMVEYAGHLRQAGHEVTAEWITGTHDGAADEVCALADVRDLMAADVVISFSEEDGLRALRRMRARGGRHVEMGMAIAWGKRLLLVGPRENVFHSLPQVTQFATFFECLKYIGEAAE